MNGETGHLALILALLCALLQTVIPIFGLRKNNIRLMQLAGSAALAQVLFIGIAFAALTLAFIQSDFSLELVARNSHSAKPMLYKISGVWGNHEGSILLWVLILALYGAAVPVFGKALPIKLKTWALVIQGLIGTGFLGFILFTSNPFLRLSPAPVDGNGLNPLLQDPGLAFHPPFLYLGYVGFSMAFSFAVAALLEGKVDALWARWLRPWVLAAWSFLTLGIALGSIWAYYELGWGGWWFWDPVENASLMPWIAATALLHSTLVVERRSSLVNWTVLLAILTFSLSLIGTFLVRSGVITSVHAFANDPDRGVYILAMLLVLSGGALTLYSLRAGELRAGNGFALLSKEAGLVWNNILLICATAVVFLGTFYPLLIDIVSDDKISVGPPFFNLFFGIIMGLLILFMGVAPLLKWREGSWQQIARPVAIAGGLALFGLLGFSLIGKSVFGGIGMALAIWLSAGTLWSFAQKVRLGGVSAHSSIQLARALPAGFYAFLLAHLGLAGSVLGVTGMGVWADEKMLMMQPGEQVEMAGYTITLGKISQTNGKNYHAETASFNVQRVNNALPPLISERRFYPVRGMQTTEAGIRVQAGHNFYVAIGDGEPEHGWAVRLYYHPLVNWIWIGSLFMALGGFLAMADRRMRMPSPSRSVQSANISQTKEAAE